MYQWDGWKKIFFTENEHSNSYNIKSNFNHLRDMLEDPGSVLHGHKFCYIYGATERKFPSSI
jgi:hypothetical protein